MFGLAQGIYQSYLAPIPLNILLIGVEGVGKTTLLERVKVTQFRKQPPSTIIHRSDSGSSPSYNRRVSSRSRMLACPSPGKYRNANTDNEQVRLMDPNADQEDTIVDNNDPAQPEIPPAQPFETRLSSLEDIHLEDEIEEEQPQSEDAEVAPASGGSASQAVDDEEGEDEEEHHVKPGAKMLPLDKIRPTIGMNLAKVDICQAKCQIWDLGGKMHDLWGRYYQDADAVIFCITPSKESSLEKQQDILEHVRSQIPDDVPFVVFVQQDWKTKKQRQPRVMLEHLLPHYHNNMMTLFTGSAKTGEGVRDALEWLVVMAKRQFKLRPPVIDAK